jgi:hypothetical protein
MVRAQVPASLLQNDPVLRGGPALGRKKASSRQLATVASPTATQASSPSSSLE